jgi:hypothetical protein
MNNVSIRTSLATRLVDPSTQESTGTEFASSIKEVAPSSSSTDRLAPDVENIPSWVAESRSSTAAAAYIVLSALLTSMAMGIYAIVALVRALN